MGLLVVLSVSTPICCVSAALRAKEIAVVYVGTPISWISAMRNVCNSMTTG